MKKFIIIAIALFTAAAVYAQPRAIGGRLGYGLELNYQHSLGNNMLDIDFGLPGFYGIEAAATYDWVFPINSWQESRIRRSRRTYRSGIQLLVPYEPVTRLASYPRSALLQQWCRIQLAGSFPGRYSTQHPLSFLKGTAVYKKVAELPGPATFLLHFSHFYLSTAPN